MNQYDMSFCGSDFERHYGQYRKKNQRPKKGFSRNYVQNWKSVQASKKQRDKYFDKDGKKKKLVKE